MFVSISETYKSPWVLRWITSLSWAIIHCSLWICTWLCESWPHEVLSEFPPCLLLQHSSLASLLASSKAGLVRRLGGSVTATVDAGVTTFSVSTTETEYRRLQICSKHFQKYCMMASLPFGGGSVECFSRFISCQARNATKIMPPIKTAKMGFE